MHSIGPFSCGIEHSADNAQLLPTGAHFFTAAMASAALCSAESVVIASSVTTILETISSTVAAATTSYNERPSRRRRLVLEQAVADALRPFANTDALDMAISAASDSVGDAREFKTALVRIFVENVRVCDEAYMHDAFPHKRGRHGTKIDL